jgi:GH25 family lysozyme M1 (1,4-beta-N-acetylmuramidase)
VAAADPVGWCAAWLAAAADALGVQPLLYLDRSRLHGADWTPVVAAGSALWLACWDGDPGPVDAGAWPGVTVKQYSDAGCVPGVDGPVDLDVLLGGAEGLRALGRRPG